MTTGEIILATTLFLIMFTSVVFITRALKKVTVLRLKYAESKQKNEALSEDIDNMNHQINALKQAYTEYAIQSRFELESQRREDAERRLEEIFSMNSTSTNNGTPIVINTIVPTETKAESSEVIEEAVVDNETIDQDDEAKIQALIAEYQEKFKQEWESELLKKYPNLLKEHYQRKAFSEKVMGLDKEQKENYSNLKNMVMQYNISKNRITKLFDTFYLGTKVICKIGITKNSIKVFMDLDPNAYPTNKYPHKDVSNQNRHAKTPYMMMVRSPLSLRRAEKLLADLFAKYSIEKKENYKNKDYARSVQVLYHNQNSNKTN